MIRKFQHGFTLIELLVVIAIISILVAILFPVFAKARAQANATNCLDNQRQLTISILSYVQDNDGTLPLPTNWVEATGLQSDQKVWSCPSVSTKGTPAAPNYGFNGRIYDLVTRGATTTVAAASLGEITTPEQIEATTDLNATNYLAPSNATVVQQMESGHPIVNSYCKDANFCHSGGCITSYLDGHVAYLPQQQAGKGTSKYNIPCDNQYYVDFTNFQPMVMGGTPYQVGGATPWAPTTTPATTAAQIAAFMFYTIGYSTDVKGTWTNAANPILTYSSNSNVAIPGVTYTGIGNSGSYNTVMKAWDLPVGQLC